MNNRIKLFFSCATMALLSCENDDLVTKLEKQSSIDKSSVSVDNDLKEIDGAISYIDGPIYKDEETATVAEITPKSSLSNLNIQGTRSEVTPADLAAMGFTDTPDNALNNFRAVMGFDFTLVTRPSNVYINDWTAIPETDFEKVQYPVNVRSYKQCFGKGIIEPIGPVRNWAIDENFYQSIQPNRSKATQIIGGNLISIRLISKAKNWEINGTPGTALKLQSQISFKWRLGDNVVASAPIEKGKKGFKTTTQIKSFQIPKQPCPPGHEVVYTLMSRWKDANTKYRIVVMFTGEIMASWLGSNNPRPQSDEMHAFVAADSFFYTYGVQPGDKVYSLSLQEQADKEYMVRASVRKSNLVSN